MRDAMAAFGLDCCAHRRCGASPAGRARVRGAPHRAGTGAGVARPAGGGGHRDQRRQPRSASTSPAWPGHAGTVPMTLRRDALAAAAECVLAIERLAGNAADVVATVGRLDVSPGAVNVIPGHVRFTLDVRAPTDDARHAAPRGDAQPNAARSRSAAASTSRSRRCGMRARPRATRDCSSSSRRPSKPKGCACTALPSGAGPRRHGAHRHRADRHAVRPLQGRHQPQSGRGGRRRRRRRRRARAAALHPPIRPPDAR